MSKKRMITKSVIFLLILAFILKIFSSLSIAMGYNANPLYNYSSYSIFQEPDNSIDVLSIGDSNVYSSIFPLVWWEQQGFTGYTWGQPSQRIPETYEYLKKIYKHQKPSIVLIDGNNLFLQLHGGCVDLLITSTLSQRPNLQLFSRLSVSTKI